MMDELGLLDSSRSLQTRFVISFVISLQLILQMFKIPFQKCKMQSDLNKAILVVVTWDLLSLPWYGDVGALCCDAWSSPNLLTWFHVILLARFGSLMF